MSRSTSRGEGRVSADAAAVSLARLVRYPIKGFNGQELSGAVLAPGCGLPYDRALAVTNGTLSLAPAGGWTRCEAFVRLTKNTDLPRYRLSVNDATDPQAGSDLRLTGPDGAQLQVSLEDSAGLPAANDVLGRWFGSGPCGPPRLVGAEQGLWDHQDAVLSIINLETVRQLEDAAGTHVDPLRFRGNLYLSGLPAWHELAWVGRRVRLGDVELEILRPIDRCAATSVDPRDATTDLNLPALLAARYGHLYCGVYARVSTGGQLSVGQPVGDVGTAKRAVHDGRSVSTAPPVGQWPRLAVVTERIEESATATSYWLADPLSDHRPAPLPGQHLRVHATDRTGPFWRAYTVSGVERDRLRITVKHGDAEARMARRLHRAAVSGSELLITGPFGDVTLQPTPTGRVEAPLLLASAGIGITPTVAMLRALADAGSKRPVAVLHVARDGSDLALWAEALALTDRLPGAGVELFLTRGAPSDTGARAAREGRPGRPDLARLVETFDPRGLTAHLCGPAAFMQNLRELLVELGVHPERIRTEVFASPSARAGNAAAPPLPGPFEVRFLASEVATTWTPSSGSLLDAAEAAGLSLPAGCRAAACGSCAQALATGSVAYTSQPVLAPPLPTVLLCCTVPTGDISIQA